MSSETKEELLRAAHHYLETFLLKRDPQASAALTSDGVCGFGTAEHERVYTIDRALDLFNADIEALPSPIDYELLRIHSRLLTPECGLVMGEMNWSFRHMEQTARLLNVRFSMVLCRRPDGRWLLEHKHLSQPSVAQQSGEGYPLKELEERHQVLERLVRERTSDLEETNRQMQRLAITDVLTGLYNRLRTDEVLDTELERQRRHPGPLSIILLDLDHFKLINDRYGHRTGDRILRELGGVLADRVRKTDCLGRWGGEEFLVICPHTDRHQSRALAESLRQAVAEKDFELEAPVTISLGVAGHHPGDTREVLIERADQALYRAKQEGRDRVMVSP